MRSEHKSLLVRCCRLPNMRSSASMDCFHAWASEEGPALSTTEINFIKNLGKVFVCVFDLVKK